METKRLRLLPSVGHDHSVTETNTSHRYSGAPATEETIAATFERLGMRATRPRRLIATRIAELGAEDAEFTAEDLWKDLLRLDPGIGRATVFRSVQLMVREGLLDRVYLADGTHRYRVCGPNHHHHITCVSCNRVVEIDECLAPDLLSAIASSTDFAIEGHSLEVYGRCSVCRAPR